MMHMHRCRGSTAVTALTKCNHCGCRTPVFASYDLTCHTTYGAMPFSGSVLSVVDSTVIFLQCRAGNNHSFVCD
jgi:hypothetical protein